MKQFLIAVFSLITFTSAQSTWMWSGRVHPELKWQTISTEHFNIHYHQGIEDIAEEGAIIAEHVRPTLLAQMDLDTIPKIDIIFTSEDEIFNGFATWMYNTFIWVDQNDASIWLEKGKWLEQVLSHELQHIVFFHKTRSWFPQPWAWLLSGTPGWAVEGTAEYETESWRPYRADLSHKTHVLKNSLNEMDPHHDGFSKMLYWADRFGDSTIAKTLGYRNKLKLFNFKKGFKKATGISVKQFNEDWRRHMNTYYYGYRSQKETYKEIGEVVNLPIKKMQWFQFHMDSTKIALLGRDDKEQGDISLFTAVRDTAEERKRFEKWEEGLEKLKKKKKKTKQDSLNLEKPYKPKVLWKKDEVDFGQFHPSLNWSLDGKKLAYSKYHFGRHQSQVFDIKVYDTEKEEDLWLTNSMRATYPVWLDSNTIAFTAHHNNVSNIYSVNLNEKAPKPLTHFTGNTQITHLSVSPDSEHLAFAISPKNANLDIYTLNLKSGVTERLTTDPLADILPTWHPDGAAISYTANRNGVPNIHTINLSNGDISANTDAGDGIWAHQWVPEDSLLFARTLSDVDSTRLVKVNPFRQPDTTPISLRDNYTRWLKSGPDVSFVNAKPEAPAGISKPRKYSFTKHIRHATSLVIPDVSTFAMTQWTDALGRHLFSGIGILNARDLAESGYYLGYTNAQHGPLWSVSVFKNTMGSFRFYDGANMVDTKNGVQFSAGHPMNFGESQSSSHELFGRLTLINHDVTVGTRTDKKTGKLIPRDTSQYVNLPIPDAGNDGYLSIGYLWSNKRPHKWNGLHPTQGFGLYAKADYANKSLFGNFSYTRFTTDGYFNLPVGKTAFYFRLKTVALSGQPPAQDYVGLSDDAPIYLNAPLPTFDEFLPENHNLRGWSGYRLGDRLIFGSLEYRLPVVPKIFSMALISDFGNAWYSGQEKQDIVITAGYEARLGLGLLVLSAGEAQATTDWQKNLKPNRYFRLALINPF